MREYFENDPIRDLCWLLEESESVISAQRVGDRHISVELKTRTLLINVVETDCG
jgi:hypothetical protein